MSLSRQVRRHQERQARKGKSVFTPPKPKPEQEQETLVACALIDAEGTTHHGFKAHWELRASLGREDPHRPDMSDTYGFWTSEGRFVTRAEAARLIGWTAQRELLSSDVW